MCPTNAPHRCHLLLWLIKLKIVESILHLDLRVDLFAGRRTLVPGGGNEGTDGELQYVDVTQDLDPSQEGPKANLASEGKPRIINPVF
jgi:hypothetical protein